MANDNWRVPGGKCPACGHKLTGAGAAPGESTPRPPNPGDPNVCIECATVLVFNADLTVRRPTADEVMEWLATPGLIEDIERARAQIRAFNAIHRGRGQN